MIFSRSLLPMFGILMFFVLTFFSPVHSSFDADATRRLSEVVRGNDSSEATLALIRSLISQGANINVRVEPSGLPLLAYASSPEVAQCFLYNHARIRAQSPMTRETALHHAIKEKRFEMVKCLVEFGADLTTIKD